MVAALGVVMNTETGKQKFYGGRETEMLPKGEGEQLEFHRDDILSIDLCSDRKLVVTG
jgi:WD40 repeat protein